MADEEKEFANEESEEKNEEEESTNSDDTVKSSANGLAKVILGLVKIVIFPFKLLLKSIAKYPKLFLVIFLVLAAVGGTVYFARTNPELLGISTGQDVVESQKEVSNLIEEVGKLIKLPSDENPTIATVTDAEKLSAQPFFADAQNGDKVLIYTNSKKIYLYRPSEKRIIEASIINIAQKEAVVTETPPPDISPTPTGI